MNDLHTSLKQLEQALQEAKGSLPSAIADLATPSPNALKALAGLGLSLHPYATQAANRAKFMEVLKLELHERGIPWVSAISPLDTSPGAGEQDAWVQYYDNEGAIVDYSFRVRDGRIVG